MLSYGLYAMLVMKAKTVVHITLPLSLISVTNYYLLTEFAFRTVRYQDQGPEVRTELARSLRKDRGLNILQYEKQTRLINSLLDGQEMRNGKPSLKVSVTWV